MGYVLGIDIGTTYSAAAVADDGRAEIFTLGHNSPTIPSIVLLRADGEVLVGEAAERRGLTEPSRVARQFKRRLGDPVPMILGGTPYGAETLYGHLLQAIAARVVSERGAQPEVIVLSHPASWGPYKTDLLQQAVRQAGLGRARLVTEPEAAAISYANRQHLNPGDTVAVYDFGGGTFDASVLRTTVDGFELLGEPEGMERLGGIDFDEAIFSKVRREMASAFAAIDESNPAHLAAVAQLRQQCRTAKEALSVDIDVSIPVLLPDVHDEVVITRAEFEDMIRPRVRESIGALERAVHSAGLTYDDLTRVLLVGGSSRIPLIGREIEAVTGRPVAVDANPKYAIALGAALAVGHGRAGTVAMTAVSPDAAPPPPTVAGVLAVDGLGEQSGVHGYSAPEPGSAGAPRASTAPSVGDAAVSAPPTVVTPSSPPTVAVATPEARETAPFGAVPTTPLAPASPPPQPSARAQAPDQGPPDRGGAPPASMPLQPSGGDRGGPPRSKAPLLVAAVVAVLAGIVGAVVLSGGGGEDDSTLTAQGATTLLATTAAGAASATPTTATGATSAVPTTATGATSAVPTTAAGATATTRNLAMPSVTITGVRLNGDAYWVSYETSFEPSIPDPTKWHIHFYFDSVPETAAGVPGAGPWILYDTPSPFTGYKVSDRPAVARAMCASVATHDHRVVANTQSCWPLPS